MRAILFFIVAFAGLTTYAQTRISGKVTDSQGMPIPGANVLISGTSEGTATDFEGEFVLETSTSVPFTLNISIVGFRSTQVSINQNNQRADVQLTEDTTQLEEIVLAASRTPERIFESPVTVERFGLQQIKNTASADFYDGLENLKGVDINTNSLTFKSVNTRGFATFANTRFVQLVDGMDNTAPALNFVLGNLLGMTELDVQSIELLPGASSALYGANAFNGILFMRSKSPFDHTGVSFYARGGVTSQEAAGDNGFVDFGIRLAYKFSDKFAAKVNFSYLNGTDWFAVDEQDLNMPGGTRETNINYNGLNVYGDEVATNIRGVGQALEGLGILPPGLSNLLPNTVVSRTGYLESDLTDYNAESIKTDWALHFRPFADDFEIIYQGKIGNGSTIYQGANRYYIKDFFLQQHKLEVRNDNFFVRGYITDEDAGNSYDMRFTGININRAWSPDSTWFGEYAGAFIQASLAGAPESVAHDQARAFADRNRAVPGTERFNQLLNQVTSNPDLTTGSLFRDATQLRHVDANYNFAHITHDVIDVMVGGSYREYKLNSFGTIYTDGDGPIRYSEYGAYTQLQKLLFDDRFKVTGSIRYDKSELFDGNVSPRVSLAYTLGEDRAHNVRFSAQTGFRNPTTQDLYIGLDAGSAILVGSAEDNLDRDVRTYPVNSAIGQAALGGANSVDIVGRAAYENSFTLSSVRNQTFQKSDVGLVQPEKVTAFELGYRGKVDRFTIDASTYYNKYKDFISNETVIVPFYGTVGDPNGGNNLAIAAVANSEFKAYQTYTNSDVDIKSWGASIGVTAKVVGNYELSANYTYTDFEYDETISPDFEPSFNTPQHKVKTSFGNDRALDNLGFLVSWRWSDSYFWQATFADGDIPSFNVLDAQISFRVPSFKSTFKVGGSNILNKEYYTAFGTGYIGAQYYISWSINNL